MRVFNEVRTVLLDSTPNGIEKRKQMAEYAGVAKVGTTLGSGVCGLVSLVSLNAMRAYPLMGGFFFVVSSVTGLSLFETATLAKNIEKLSGGNGVTGNLFQRATSSWSSAQFVNQVTKNTLVVGPFFGPTIARALEEDLKRA